MPLSVKTDKDRAIKMAANIISQQLRILIKLERTQSPVMQVYMYVLNANVIFSFRVKKKSFALLKMES